MIKLTQSDTIDGKPVTIGMIRERLAAYEETGLSPESVMAIAKNSGWIEIYNRLIDELIKLAKYEKIGTLEQITARIQNGESAIDTNRQLIERIDPLNEKINELDHELNECRETLKKQNEYIRQLECEVEAYHEHGTPDEFGVLKETEQERKNKLQEFEKIKEEHNEHISITQDILFTYERLAENLLELIKEQENKTE